MLLLLKQTAASSDRNMVLQTEGSIVSLGTVKDILHQESTSLELMLDWRLEKTLSLPIEGSNDKENIDHLTFLSSIGRTSNGPDVQKMSYSSDQFIASMQQGSKEKYKIEVRVADKNPARIQGRPPNISKPIKCYGFPSEALQYYQNADYLIDLNGAFEELFRNVFYLGPLRDDPKRIYQVLGNRPDDVGRKGELAVATLVTAGRDKILKEGRRWITLEEKIADWLKRMGLVHSFRTNPLLENGSQYQVLIKRTSESREVPITDLGFGISQVLPVLVMCYYTPKSSTVILEQPEIHLHPAVQAVLADVFIDAIKTRHIQIILESHSEHLLRRLQRRMAEKLINVSDAALYFCQMEGGSSRIDALQLSEYGDITNWPDGFFGDLADDLIEMAKASIDRQMAE